MTDDTKPPVTPAEFAERMRQIAKTTDPESGHQFADDLLCEVLRSLGYGEGVKIFEGMMRWYA